MTPEEPLTPPEFDGSMNRLEELLAEVERLASPESLETVRELVRTLLEVHRPGLEEMLAALGTSGTSGTSGTKEEAFRALCDRPSVATLLLMHDLHPQGLHDRMKRALREAHDAAGHDARAEVWRIDGSRVFVRVHGENPAGKRLLRRALERVALERAPDAVLDIEGGEEPPEPGLIPVARLVSRGGKAAD
jgi:hypothetical protein